MKMKKLNLLSIRVICFLAYFGVSTAVTMMVPYSELHGNAAVTDTFKRKAPPAIAYIIGIGSLLGLSGCSLIHIFPIPRMLYAFAKDGMIFKVFSSVHRDTRVPFVATISSGVFVGVMAMLLDLDSLVEMLSIGTLFAYTFVDICVLVVRYRRQNDESIKSEKISVHTESTKLLKTPSKNKTNVLYWIILVIVTSCFVSSIMLQYYSSLKTTKTAILSILSLCIVLILGCTLYLSCQRQNPDKLAFKTPLVPWLPILAIFCNSYLMVSLQKETWIRLGVWFVIGTIIYFSYSIFHSVERFNPEQKDEIDQDEAL